MKSRATTAILFVAVVGILSAISTLSGRASTSEIGTGVQSPVSANNARTPLIRLKFATFDPLDGEPPMPPALQSRPYPAEAGPYIVQFEGPVLEPWRDAILAAGALIEGYIPDFAFLVRMDADMLPRLRRLPFVRWIGHFQPGYKMPPGLGANPYHLYRLTLAGWADPKTVMQQLSAQGIAGAGGGTSMVVSARLDQLPRIAQLPDVLWIEDFQFFQTQNDIAGGIIDAAAAWVAGYDGVGQLVTVADTGLDTGVDGSGVGDMHLDFDNRVDQISSPPVTGIPNCIGNAGANDGPSDKSSGHGTHVAGSVAGNGARSSGQYKGPAFAATLTFQAIEQLTQWIGPCAGEPPYALTGLPNDLNDLFQEAYDWGSRIHTNSWGSDVYGAYDLSSQQVDQFTWNHKDFLILFAAGNFGVDANANGYVDTDSLGSPATAKNSIAVGASENLRASGGLNPGAACSTYGTCWPGDFTASPTKEDPLSDSTGEMAAFSSRGPTDDGRIKPDVVAPGTNILSTRSSLISGNGWGPGPNSYYMYLGGTSMATPLAAGAATVVRDYLVDGEGMANPSAALIKAILINTAVDIAGYGAPGFEAGQPIPNPHEGWGRINLGAATDGANRTLVDDLALNTGISHALYFTVTNPAEPLKISLVWSDYPGLPAATLQLVNDLDLKVTAPDGTTIYRGNQFLGGWSTPGGAADSTNNVENVYIQTPSVGPWLVEVVGSNVPQPRQPYALVIHGDGLFGGPPVQQGELFLPAIMKPPPPVVQFANGDFESGPSGWTEYSSNGYPLILSLPDVPETHGGNWAVWLGGADAEISYIEQQIVVPPTAPHMNYWMWINSDDTCGFDFAVSIINGLVVDQYDLCSVQNTNGWVLRSVNLSAYAGQNVAIQIRAETDQRENTISSLLVDDVSFQVTAGQAIGVLPRYQPNGQWRTSEILGATSVHLVGGSERLFVRP